MSERVDVVVIGMGIGGEAVAGRLAEEGLTVVGIERQLVGGECPYWGCIPSKMMIRAANALAEARRIPGLAGEADVRPDWAPVAARIRAEATDDWNDAVAVERFEAKGGIFVRGEGRIVGPGRVVGGGREFEATRAIVVASGTTAAVPPIPGLSETPYWTNREIIETKDLPESLAVLGGGAIGAELAQAFARFGAEVTVVEALDRILPLEESEASEVVTSAFGAEGIRVVTGAAATSASYEGRTFTLELGKGGPVTAEHLLVATGRRADPAAVGLDTIGVDGSGRWIPVDERLRVAPGVWAVGDVTGVGAFTHVAAYQAGIAASDILGQDPGPADYRALPRVTFTDPEVGSVGLREGAARDAGLTVRVGTVSVPSTARGWIHKVGNEGVIKVVEDEDRGVLVGATAVGPHGGEVLGLLALAVHAAVPVEQLRSMIYAYPTFHRGIEDALRDLRS